MDSPSTKITTTPTMPLFPLSPSRDNIKHLPTSPSLPNFSTIDDPYDAQSKPMSSAHSSPTHKRHQNSDVQGMVARFNALEIKDHAELRRRDEAALRRAQVAREQAEEDARRAKEEGRALRREVDEGRERERRVVRRLDAVMEQFHSEKEKTAAMQKTYEREIRRARKEAFKSSSALLETQKELKLTKANLNAAKVNLEKWVVPEGEELKGRAEGLEMELAKAQRLVEFMKMECQFGACACRVAEMKGDVYAVDGDPRVLELMGRLKPAVSEVVMDDPPAYEEHTPTPAPPAANEKDAMEVTTTSRRSSTVQPPGETMTFSPNSGTFRRIQPESKQADTDDHQQQPPTNQPNEPPSSITAQDFALLSERPQTPTTPATTIPPTSPEHDIPTASEDEHDEEPKSIPPRSSTHKPSSPTPPPITTSPPAFEHEPDTPYTLTDPDPDADAEDLDLDPPDSPTTHIRATTQTTTVPLAGMSSPFKASEAAPDSADASFQTAATSETARSRATTPAVEDKTKPGAAPVTPRVDADVSSGGKSAGTVTGSGEEDILSRTPWAQHASTPLTRDEAIAMLRARRGRARTQGQEEQGRKVNTPVRSASQGYGLSARKGVGEGRRDISTVSAPEVGRGRSEKKGGR